jgi:outer membrane beta-barrel protein
VMLVACGAIVGVSATAVAQDDAPSPAAGLSMEDDFDAFWSEQRRVRVLQRRLYETSGELQLTLFMGAIPNDPFLKYWPLGLRVGYWTSESIAIELTGSYIGINGNTDLANFLDERGNVDVFLRDVQQWRVNVVALWSPIYGKFSFVGTKLAHFDWYFGGGAGVLGVENPQEGNLTIVESEIKPEVVLLTGWNLHLSQRFALRMDYRQHIFEKSSGGVATPSEFSIGGSVFF